MTVDDENNDGESRIKFNWSNSSFGTIALSGGENEVLAKDTESEQEDAFEPMPPLPRRSPTGALLELTAGMSTTTTKPVPSSSPSGRIVRKESSFGSSEQPTEDDEPTNGDTARKQRKKKRSLAVAAPDEDETDLFDKRILDESMVHRREKKPNGLPKRPLSSFSYFFQRERIKLMQEDPEKKMGAEDLEEMVGRRWRTLPESELRIYQDLAEKDGKRYHREMETYNKSGGGKRKKKKRNKNADKTKTRQELDPSKRIIKPWDLSDDEQSQKGLETQQSQDQQRIMRPVPSEESRFYARGMRLSNRSSPPLPQYYSSFPTAPPAAFHRYGVYCQEYDGVEGRFPRRAMSGSPPPPPPPSYHPNNRIGMLGQPFYNHIAPLRTRSFGSTPPRESRAAQVFSGPQQPYYASKDMAGHSPGRPSSPRRQFGGTPIPQSPRSEGRAFYTSFMPPRQQASPRPDVQKHQSAFPPDSFPLPLGMEFMLPGGNGNMKRYEVQYALVAMSPEEAQTYMEQMTQTLGSAVPVLDPASGNYVMGEMRDE